MPTPFGDLLRKYRESSKDPLSSRRLTQQRFGELLGEKLNLQGGYSGTAVSDWERGASVIHHNDRPVLIAIVQVLYICGGIETILTAREFLEAGNYKSLDTTELKRIFPRQQVDDEINRTVSEQYPTWIVFLSKTVFFENPELTTKLAEAEEGPPPSWPRKLIVLINGGMSGWNIDHVPALFWWFIIWLLGHELLSPSLRWPFADSDEALQAMWLYVAGSFLVPCGVTLLVNANNNPFWKELQGVNPWVVFLYTCQGAFVGFHVGYALRFVPAFFGYYLSFPSFPWLEWLAVLLILIWSYLGAQLVPYNLWRAFKRLDLKDGAVFFVFVLFGPLWAIFFFFAYPYLLGPLYGLPAMLTAFGILIYRMLYQKNKTGSTVLPVSWWVFLFGLGLVLGLGMEAKSLFGLVALGSIILAFWVLLKLEKIQPTLPGMLGWLVAMGILLLVFKFDLWLGRAATIFALLAWWRWGTKYLSFPLVFWVVIGVTFVFALLWQQQWLSDLGASILLAVIVLSILLWESRSAFFHRSSDSSTK